MHRADAELLRSAASAVLRANDRGTVLVASPPGTLHRTNGDVGLTTVGLSRIDVPRAIAELRGLLATQWSTGMLPQGVFVEDGPGIQPGICALPTQAIALRFILDRGHDAGGADLAAAEEFALEAFDALLAWHRWLAAARDPEGVGLVEIHHPWESGFGSSPRWDGPLSRVGPSVDATRTERNLWLIDQLRAAGYDNDVVATVGDFRVRDVHVSALLAASSEVLAEIGDEVGRSDVTVELKGMAARFRDGVAGTVDPAGGLARDFDVLTSAWIATPTVAGFAPLVAGGDAELLASQRTVLLGEGWMGHGVLRYPLPPTVSPSSSSFRRRTPWRGPVSPGFNLLLGWASTRDSAWELRAVLREASLDQLSDHAFGECYEPITGESLGARNHTSTAAAALEWLG